MYFPTLVLFLLSSSIPCVLIAIIATTCITRKSMKLPPGPHPLPFLGNILLLLFGKTQHRTLAKLAKTYGPIMHLKLGTIHSIIISSPAIAREILQTQDKLFSARTIPHSAHGMDHYKTSIAWLPTGPKWRRFRRMYIEELLTKKKMDASEYIRREKVRQMCDYMKECCMMGRDVDIGHVSFVTTLNVIWWILFSIDFSDYDSKSVHHMKEVILGVTQISGTPNFADFFPVLRLLDPQGIKRQAGVYYGKLLSVFEKVVTERLNADSGASPKLDLLEVLIRHHKQNQEEFSLCDIKHVVLDLITGGPDTTSATIEWAMTELFLYPDKLCKLKNELTTILGTKKVMEEHDIQRLPYLRAVIKEIYRLHPSIPLLPHKAQETTEINGYTVPKEAQVLVNVWAIGRDSGTWTDPESFEPERFLDRSTNYGGHDFELLSFGSGRRSCPGLPLADQMVHLLVATLVHEFEWKMEHANAMEKNKNIDVVEISGITVRKMEPLRIIPVIKT